QHRHCSNPPHCWKAEDSTRTQPENHSKNQYRDDCVGLATDISADEHGEQPDRNSTSNRPDIVPQSTDHCGQESINEKREHSVGRDVQNRPGREADCRRESATYSESNELESAH